MHSDVGQVKLRGFLRPVGKSRARTYWVRRLASIVILGLVVLASIWYVPRMISSSKVSLKPVAHTARLLPSCDESQIGVRIASVTRSDSPRVQIAVTNLAPTACLLDTQAVGVLAVGRHGKAWWMSVNCAGTTPTATGLIKFAALASVTWNVDWRQRVSSRYCARIALGARRATKFYAMALGHVTEATAR